MDGHAFTLKPFAPVNEGRADDGMCRGVENLLAYYWELCRDAPEPAASFFLHAEENVELLFDIESILLGIIPLTHTQPER